jgi:hypothetical protein
MIQGLTLIVTWTVILSGQLFFFAQEWPLRHFLRPDPPVERLDWTWVIVGRAVAFSTACFVSLWLRGWTALCLTVLAGGLTAAGLALWAVLLGFPD